VPKPKPKLIINPTATSHDLLAAAGAILASIRLEIDAGPPTDMRVALTLLSDMQERLDVFHAVMEKLPKKIWLHVEGQIITYKEVKERGDHLQTWVTDQTKLAREIVSTSEGLNGE
jgi:hypothetical protein